tara:strand:+ start:138 stop:374 length:237 start_codon:yes stop_codon:yes gene_type:complete
MKVGDLVMITRATIGIPKNTIALVISLRSGIASATGLCGDTHPDHRVATAEVLPIGHTKVRRYLMQDLKEYKTGKEVI